MNPTISHFTIFLMFFIFVGSSASRAKIGGQENTERSSQTSDSMPDETPNGGSGSGHGPNWDYSWAWGSTPSSGWGYGSGSGKSPNGYGRGWGFGFGSGSGSGYGHGYGYGYGGNHGKVEEGNNKASVTYMSGKKKEHV